MVTKPRKSANRKAVSKRTNFSRKTVSFKSKSINARQPKRIKFSGRKKPITVAEANQPSTSGLTRNPVPTRLDITAINIPPEERRPVIIDGENLAYDHVYKQFTLARINSAIRWFKNIGHLGKVLCPEYMVQKLPDLSNFSDVVELVPNCSENPTENYDLEIVLLQRAKEMEAAIVSERTFQNSYSMYHDIVTQRIIGFTVFMDTIFIPVDPYGRAGPWLRTILRK